MTMLFVLCGVVLLLVFIVKVLVELKAVGGKAPTDLSQYQRKEFLFDSVAELNLYKLLLELFGDRYHIFTQVNYSHLIEPRKADYSEERKLRSRIDRKSADFVLCDKVRVVPQLVIELDGYTHSYKSRQARDAFIDEITKIVDLPILHIKTSDALDREYVRKAIDEKLGIQV